MTRWLMSMPPAVLGTTYFNFIASHDGIGLRPVEGLLSEAELESMREKLQANGALLSWRELASGEKSIYEVNVSLFDALRAPSGEEGESVDRMTLAHAILLGLEGVPAIYLHSFLGTRNDDQRVLHTGHNRAINRHQWDLDLLSTELEDRDSTHSQCFEQIKSLIRFVAVSLLFIQTRRNLPLTAGAQFSLSASELGSASSICLTISAAIVRRFHLARLIPLVVMFGSIYLREGISELVDLPVEPCKQYGSNLDGETYGELSS